MDELTDYSSPIVEFKAAPSSEKQLKLVDNCTGTDPAPPSKDVSVETNRKCCVETQTQISASLDYHVDDSKLAAWLRAIYPAVEAELLNGTTPLLDYNQSNLADETKIHTYQKITMGSVENSQGLATWLSVHTNNAPVLAVSTVGPHDDWCEHVDQSLKIFIPKRMERGNFVIFSEVKSVKLKACLKSLCTNAFNKNIFAGSTLDGDILVWQYEHCGNNIEIKELFSVTSTHGAAVAMDWTAENRLLSCHANGWVIQWLIGKQMLKEAENLIRATPVNGSTEISTLVAISVNDFVVGTKDGGIYHCWNSHAGVKKELEITPLRRHLFMISSLIKTRMTGQVIVISCDLSGQIFYHDIRNADDDTANVIVQIPLPFKNAIACSQDANVIYCPGNDGALECYRVRDGIHSTIKGALRGKGNLIKCSSNGYWIITGLYEDEFQIFCVEN